MKVQTLEVLWFHKTDDKLYYYPIRNVPEDCALVIIDMMKAKGYTFIPEASSSLEHCT